MDSNKKNTGARPALGKGLASLLSEPQRDGQISAAKPQADVSNKDRHPGISVALVSDIVANSYQPRQTFHDETIEELAQSIKLNGLIQPLIVRRGADNKSYQLIAGERRLRAAKLAGLTQVPIVVRKTTDKEALELALLENIQREDLNCLETALAYQQLMLEFNLTQEVVAERMGKDRATVANHLRLLRLPAKVQRQLRDNLISFGHGKVLLSLNDPELINQLADEVVDHNLSVRQLEQRIQDVKQQNLEKSKSTTEQPSEKTPLQLRFESLAKTLNNKWSTKVSFQGDAERGKIVVQYSSRAELDRVLEDLLK